MKEQFFKDVEYIVSVLRDAGYDPYEQLYAYAITGNETYITRKGDARSMVSDVDREQLRQYIAPYVKEIKCKGEKVQ